jgi:hypothetical protein
MLILEVELYSKKWGSETTLECADRVSEKSACIGEGEVLMESPIFSNCHWTDLHETEEKNVKFKRK